MSVGLLQQKRYRL